MKPYSVGGASLRSPLRLPGCCCGGSCCCYAKAGTAEGRAHKKTTQQHNKRASSLRWGFAPLAAGLPGCCCGGSCCCRATRTPDQQHNSSTQEQLFGVGLRSARRWPSGVLLRWILLLLCQSRHGRRPGPQKTKHNSTTKEHLPWGGASLRSPLRLTGCSCCRATRTPDQQHNKRAALCGGASLRSPLRLPGAAAVDPAAAGLLEQRTFAGLLEQRTFAGLLEQRTFAGLLEQRTFAGLLPLLLRPLPLSASVFASPLPPARC